RAGRAGRAGRVGTAGGYGTVLPLLPVPPILPFYGLSSGTARVWGRAVWTSPSWAGGLAADHREPGQAPSFERTVRPSPNGEAKGETFYHQVKASNPGKEAMGGPKAPWVLPSLRRKTTRRGCRQARTPFRSRNDRAVRRRCMPL